MTGSCRRPRRSSRPADPRPCRSRCGHQTAGCRSEPRGAMASRCRRSRHPPCASRSNRRSNPSREERPASRPGRSRRQRWGDGRRHRCSAYGPGPFRDPRGPGGPERSRIHETEEPDGVSGAEYPPPPRRRRRAAASGTGGAASAPGAGCSSRPRNGRKSSRSSPRRRHAPAGPMPGRCPVPTPSRRLPPRICRES